MKLDIPSFSDLKSGEELPIRPALTPRRRKGTWSLTPLGEFDETWCARLIMVLKKNGDNAVILNEEGILEFGVVRRDATADHA